MPFSNKRNSRDDNSKNSRSTSENFKPRGDRSKDDRSSNFKDSKRPRSSSFGNKDNTDRPYSSDKKSFGGDRPFKKFDGESSDRKRSFDKPFNKEGKSFGGDRPFKRDGESSDRKRSFDKPFNKEGRSFQKSEGEQTDFKRPAREKSDRQYKSSYKKFNSEEDRKEGSTERRSSERPQRSKSSSQNDGLIRLNRYIANSGVCSRRKADELIAAGVVSVNGEAVTELGAKVDPAKDDIKYNGERLKREKMVYVLLNKPKDYITTTDDPQERHTVMELVSKATKERIYPVGRLDRNTTGLLLMTNDGNLAEKLSHPRNNISKIYNVELNKSLTQGDFNKIVFGLELEDGFVKPDDLSYVIGGSKKEVGVQIHSGKNRIVRRIFESLGYEVVKLDRVVYANLTKKDLPRGRWRYIEERELVQLKHLI